MNAAQILSKYKNKFKSQHTMFLTANTWHVHFEIDYYSQNMSVTLQVKQLLY